MSIYKINNITLGTIKHNSQFDIKFFNTSISSMLRIAYWIGDKRYEYTIKLNISELLNAENEDVYLDNIDISDAFKNLDLTNDDIVSFLLNNNIISQI